MLSSKNRFPGCARSIFLRKSPASVAGLVSRRRSLGALSPRSGNRRKAQGRKQPAGVNASGKVFAGFMRPYVNQGTRSFYRTKVLQESQGYVQEWCVRAGTLPMFYATTHHAPPKPTPSLALISPFNPIGMLRNGFAKKPILRPPSRTPMAGTTIKLASHIAPNPKPSSR